MEPVGISECGRVRQRITRTDACVVVPCVHTKTISKRSSWPTCVLQPVVINAESSSTVLRFPSPSFRRHTKWKQHARRSGTNVALCTLSLEPDRFFSAVER